MPTQPLHPFAPPTNIISYLPSGVSIGNIVSWGLYAIFAIWAIYTIIVIYHWLKYSHGSKLAFPSMALHLFISFALMSYALSGHIFFISAYLP